MFFLFRIEFCGKIGLQPVRTTNTSHQKQSIEYILSTPITYALQKKNINVKFNTKLPFFKKPKISNPYIRLFKMVKKNYKRYMVSVILKKNNNWDTPWDMLHVSNHCRVVVIKLNKSLINIYG